MTNKILYFAQKGVVFSKDRKSLLFIKTESKFMPDKLNGKLALSGGKVDFGEDIDTACIREIQEETGVIVRPSVPIYTWAWTYKRDGCDIEIVANARLCVYQSGQLLTVDKQEKEIKINKVLWVPLDKIRRQDCVDDEWPAIYFVIENTRQALNMLTTEFVKVDMFRG